MSFQTRTPTREGSILLGALMIIAISSLIIAAFYQMLIPRYRAAYQSASWQEALHGAEAGADYALQALNQMASASPDPSSYDWAGNHWTVDATYPVNGIRTLETAYWPTLGGSNNVRVTSMTVDVYTRESTAPYNPWFRIRSSARADLPGRYITADRRDVELRRMKLHNLTAGKNDPYVGRTVEVIAKPKFRFPRAITTAQGLDSSKQLKLARR